MLALGAALTPTGSAFAETPTPMRSSDFDFVKEASYILDVRSAAIEAETALPAALFPGVGFSEVFLSHDLGQPQGRCQADGAMYWAGQYLEEAVLGFGAAPPDAGSVKGGYRNPVFARDVNPDFSAGDEASKRRPGVVNPAPPGQVVAPLPSDGTPLLIQSRCDSDVRGSGTGNVVDVGGVLGVVGSTTQAEVDKVTGRYTASARAYVTGITNAGSLDTVTSFMQVTQRPGAEPVVTYRLSFIDSKHSGSHNGLSQDGFTLAGTNVPVGQLVEQFNGQAKTLSAAAAAIGPFGFQVLAPQEGIVPSTEAGTTGLRYVTAPVIAAQGGLSLREGTLGESVKPRLGTVTFTGAYERGSGA